VVEGKGDEHEAMKKGWENYTVGLVAAGRSDAVVPLRRFGSSVPPAHTSQPGFLPLSQPDRTREN
jgi:hypothetical protein